jgi:hypothetical protein
VPQPWYQTAESKVRRCLTVTFKTSIQEQPSGMTMFNTCGQGHTPLTGKTIRQSCRRDVSTLLNALTPGECSLHGLMYMSAPHDDKAAIHICEAKTETPTAQGRGVCATLASYRRRRPFEALSSPRRISYLMPRSPLGRMIAKASDGTLGSQLMFNWRVVRGKQPSSRWYSRAA